jgi:hypothetical protein
MNILSNQPMYFKPLEMNKSVEVKVGKAPSEFYWMRLLTLQTSLDSSAIDVNPERINELSTPIFISSDNDLRNWNSNEIIFCTKEEYFLIRINERVVSNNGLSTTFNIDLYQVLKVQVVEGELLFPFPITVIPTGRRYINLPLGDLNYDFYSYLCD